MNSPKNHHFVPQSYLAGFGRDGRVRVRHRDGRGFVTSTRNIASEVGFYTITGQNGSRDLSIERGLSDLENKAIAVIRETISRKLPPVPGSTERLILANFVAVQRVRTPFNRALTAFASRLQSFLTGRPLSKDEMRTFLRERHLLRTPADDEVEAAYLFASMQLQDNDALSDEEIVAMPFASTVEGTAVLLRKHWSIEHARKPCLITSDNPVALWSPPTPQDRFSGIGLETASEVRFPLDIGTQLVLTNEERPISREIKQERVRAYNQYMASWCHEFVVGHPDRHKALDAVILKRRRLTVRFNMGPLMEKSADGTYQEMGEVMQIWFDRGL